MRAKKRLGQHFLRNEGVIRRIVDALEPEPGDRFLEIGPGPGTLTLPINRRGFAVTAVEVDGDMAALLRATPFDPPLRLIEGDFMDIPLDEVVEDGIKVVSNLPYNASVPILAKLLRAAPRIPLMTLMFQKEVAERVRAGPGVKDYGPISALVQCWCDIDLHFNVSPGSFRPPPKVFSQVLRLRRKSKPLLETGLMDDLDGLLRIVFQQRRKMLGGILKKQAPDWTRPAALLESLEQCGLDPHCRAEDLSPSEYARWLVRAKELS